MPIEEEVIYNVIGEEISRSNLVQEMINYYGLKREIGETAITDFNEGSEIRNLLEAIAVDIYALMEDQNQLSEIAFVETATGEWLDKHGANPFIKLARNLGAEAHGTVTFTIPEVQGTEIVIPEGTVVSSTENDLQYQTTGETIIGVGDTSADADIICLTVGEDGNCSKDTITVIDDDYLDIDGLTVNNSNSCVDGEDYEEDEEYRARLLAFERQDDFGSQGYYMELCSNVDGVHDVILVDDPIKTMKVLVNGYNKPVDDTVINDVLAVLSDLNNVVLTHNFNVDKVNRKIFDFDFTVDVTSEYETGIIKEVILKFIDGGSCSFDGRIEFTGVYTGQSVTNFELTNILQVLSNFISATVVITDEDEETVEDCIVNSDEVIQVGTITVTQNVIGV